MALAHDQGCHTSKVGNYAIRNLGVSDLWLIVATGTLLALAENGLKKRKKPLNISAIVKDGKYQMYEVLSVI